MKLKRKYTSVLATSFLLVAFTSTILLYQNCSKPINDFGPGENGGGSGDERPCSFNGSSIASGSSVPAYSASSVAAGNICQSQLRTCNDGSLSGSYMYPTCTVEGSNPNATSISITNALGQIPAFYSITDTQKISIVGPAGHSLLMCLNLSFQSSCNNPPNGFGPLPASFSCATSGSTQTCTSTNSLSDWANIGFGQFAASAFDANVGQVLTPVLYTVKSASSGPIALKINNSTAPAPVNISAALSFKFTMTAPDITWQCIAPAGTSTCAINNPAAFERTNDKGYTCIQTGSSYSCTASVSASSFGVGAHTAVFMNDVGRGISTVNFTITN